MKYKRGDCVVTCQDGCHCFGDDDKVIIVDAYKDQDLESVYLAVDPIDSFDQILYESAIQCKLHKNSKIYREVDRILEEFPEGSENSFESIDYETSIDPFNPEQPVNWNVKVGMKAIYGDFEFIEESEGNPTVIIHSHYSEENVKDEKEAADLFEYYADRNLCNSYFIPSLYHGQIVDRTTADIIYPEP